MEFVSWTTLVRIPLSSEVQFWSRTRHLSFSQGKLPNQPIRHLSFTSEKIRGKFLKIKFRRAPVWDMPEYKPEVINLLTNATKPTKTGPFFRSEILTVRVIHMTYVCIAINRLLPIDLLSIDCPCASFRNRLQGGPTRE